MINYRVILTLLALCLTMLAYGGFAHKKTVNPTGSPAAAQGFAPPDTSYTLPVVFHIVSANPSLVTDQQIVDALQDLNNAFGKSGPYSASKGADTKISFCLAHKDPDGGTTTGITRTTYYFGNNLNPYIEDDRLKKLVQWDPQHYINIWLIDSMQAPVLETYGCGIWKRGKEAGYATPPPNAGPLDGIVVSSFGFLLINCMGTYLGLYQIYQGGCTNYNCNTDGDQVCDTPPEYEPYSIIYDCANPPNTCTTDTLSGFKTDVPDQKANFMDLSLVACQNEFTLGQARKMHASILAQRSGLLLNECVAPCAGGFTASFTRNNAYPLPGDAIAFTNTSTGAANYQWLVDGTVVASTANFSYSFTAPGKYKVTLKAYNADPACFAAYTDYVTVTCGVVARFYTDKKTIASKYPVFLDSIVFTNTSSNATAYQWLVSNDKGMAEQVFSTQKSFTYIFKTPANYNIRLIAANGSCADTTEFYYISVIDPTQDGVLYLQSVYCYNQTKLQVNFFICNYGYATIPRKVPVAFYDADPRMGNAHLLGPLFIVPDSILGQCCSFSYSTIIDVGRRGLNQIYAVYNDSGTTMPLKLPNTHFFEMNYDNNIQFQTGFQFKAAITPPTAVLEPGDTLQVTGYASPDYAQSYSWAPAYNLSCADCYNPQLIADSNNTKQLVATSAYGCTDTAYATIKVPPANDYTITLNDVECAGGDSVHVNFTLANGFKRGIIPKGLAVAFYNSNPANIGATLLPPVYVVPDSVKLKTATFSTNVQNLKIGSTIYAVVNDSGTTFPLSLPNTLYLEKDYTNNITSAVYAPLSVTATPRQAILEPGDTLQMYATAGPGTITGYMWSPQLNLSCTNCDTTYLIADSNRVKLVTATNSYGCQAVDSVVVKVPPANDYTVLVNDVECAANDSLYVNFTLTNHFKRGVIPKGLTVAWYNGDPNSGTTSLLPPLFAVPDTIKLKQATFSGFIKSMPAGTIYAVVNDSGTTMPLALPNVVHLPEKDYTNNIANYAYQAQTVVLQPADTTVLRKTYFPFAIVTPVVDPATTTWQVGPGYTLSCYNCGTPLAQVFSNDTVVMHTANQFSCLIKGTAVVKILVPDMTVQLLNTACYTNDSTLVFFKICMGNNYDTVFAGMPVAFYGGNPASTGATLLQPIYYTKQATPGNCDTFFCTVATPASHALYASVNDKGQPGKPVRVYDETDYTNNVDTATTVPFIATLIPPDTSLVYGASALLTIQANGKISSTVWQPGGFITCTSCLATTAAPPYTVNYSAIARNQYFCTDTGYAVVRVYRGPDVSIPSSFTPNGDGKNDVFYVFGGKDAAIIKNFAVYNRWGNLVFHTGNVLPNNPAYGWDGSTNGEKAASGTYVYDVTMQFADGSEKHYKGTVVLVR